MSSRSFLLKRMCSVTVLGLLGQDSAGQRSDNAQYASPHLGQAASHSTFVFGYLIIVEHCALAHTRDLELVKTPHTHPPSRARHHLVGIHTGLLYRS